MKKKPESYCLKTFGCQMNYADSEKVNMALLQAGMRKSIEPANADVVILNTCSVRQKGEDRVFGYVNEVRKLSEKTGRPVLIGITGCMVRKSGIAKKFLPEGTQRNDVGNEITLLESGTLENWDDPLFFRTDDIDFCFRIEETGRLAKILSYVTETDIGNDEKWEEYLKMRQSRENPSSANVIVQTGCDNFCSFCIVPHTRGREISRPMEEIVEESVRAAAEGAKELTLLGQNVNSYGKEMRKKLWNSESLTWNKDAGGELPEKTPFRELLEKLGGVKGIERIRFTSSNPHDMTKDILDAHFEIPAMTNCLHVALQSGSDRILKLMNRKHKYSDFLAIVRYLRSIDPLFSITTDLIVGFPGESEEDFEKTLSAMEECEFDFAYVARYSPRKGTFATDRIGDDIPTQTKALRWNRANAVLEKTAKKRLLSMVGRTEEVLVTLEGKNGELRGRTRNFKEVYFVWDAKIHLGKTVRVAITDADDWVLKGTLA